MKVYKVYKKIGETPLEALEKFRKQKKIASSARLTYIGRLDPMASGVLLILEGATQIDREKYMGLDKEYKVQVLFGFETDSFDLLGVPVLPFRAPAKNPLNQEQNNKRDPSLRRDGLKERLDELEKLLKIYQGTITLPVPPYSSVPYKGKPLFEWARSGKLKSKDIPKREMNVKKIKLGKLVNMSAVKLLSYIQKNIKKVKGDFRQEKIFKAWSNILTIQSVAKNPLTKKYLISNILISVSSGTYIRSIAHDLGKKLKTGAVVFSLERTRVEKYK